MEGTYAKVLVDGLQQRGIVGRIDERLSLSVPVSLPAEDAKARNTETSEGLADKVRHDAEIFSDDLRAAGAEDPHQPFSERGELEKLIATFDVAKEALATFLSDLHGEWETAFGEKSEKWQEGEAGQAARERIDTLAAWIDQIESVESPDISEIDE